MQLTKTPLLSAAAILGLAGRALACVNFGITIDEFQFGSGSLIDNGGNICNYNADVGSDGYHFNCESGYSTFVSIGGHHVTYATPHGTFKFATNCVGYNDGIGDGYTVCGADVLGCSYDDSDD